MINIFTLCAVLIVFFASATSASAYGGGGGFPPGYFDNPHPKHKLVCQFEKKILPNGKEITIPSCKVIKENTSTKKDNKALQQRLKEFISRIQKGGK